MTSPPGGTGFHSRRPPFLKLGLAQLHTGGLQRIDQRQQLPLPADELDAGLTDAPIVVGDRAQRVDLFGRRRNVLRPSLSAVGKDRAFVEFAAGTTAVRLPALSPQDIERAWQERLALETVFEQSRELLLGLGELGAE